MANDPGIMRFEQSVLAPIEQVFKAFSNGTVLREWFCDYATTDPRPGGRIYLAWNEGYYMAGHFKEIEAPFRMVFSWYGKGEPGVTEVGIELSAADGKVLVQLEQRGLGAGPEWDAMRSEVNKGWGESLQNLASTLETGEDLRFVSRPMLGITFSDFSPELAAKHGIPVSQGLRLDEPVPGLGAAKAGLRSGDVIVGMDNQPVVDFASLVAAIQPHKAGDRIDVTIYRGMEKLTLWMELSRRVLPEIPATPQALADQIHPVYLEQDQELRALFANVDETSAHRSPGAEEWSALEVLAHLIHTERGYQNFVQEVVGGQEPQYDDFGGNLHARNRATVQSYGSLAAMLDELQRAGSETVLLIGGLPADFPMRKSTYWRFALSALQAPYHFRNHLEQIKSALSSS